MPKSKNRKNHKQKVNARKVNSKNESSRVQKAQKEFIENLIKQEQERGLFENNLNLNGPILDTPLMAGPTL
jgi:hypothetical protein